MINEKTKVPPLVLFIMLVLAVCSSVGTAYLGWSLYQNGADIDPELVNFLLFFSGALWVGLVMALYGKSKKEKRKNKDNKNK